MSTMFQLQQRFFFRNPCLTQGFPGSVSPRARPREGVLGQEEAGSSDELGIRRVPAPLSGWERESQFCNSCSPGMLCNCVWSLRPLVGACCLGIHHRPWSSPT